MITPQKTKLFMIVNLKSNDYTLSSYLHGAVNGAVGSRVSILGRAR
jgi:hypothetical protein